MKDPVSHLSCVWDIQADLGEGPVWSAPEQALYFVDITRSAIHRYCPHDGQTNSWEVPGRPGFLVPRPDGTFLCGMDRALYRFDPRSGATELAMLIEAEYPQNRINDGYVDHQGRLWFGTMDDAQAQPTGALYCVSGAERHARRRDEGYVVSNGPAVSPDGRTLYHNHSSMQVIYAFDLGPDGEIGNRRVFAILDDGYPDGIAVDSAGILWVGTWGGGCINRFSADGVRLAPVEIPARNVTKIAFGGDDLRTVFVTTARRDLDDAELARHSLSGGLFSFRTEIPGQAQNLLALEMP